MTTVPCVGWVTAETVSASPSGSLSFPSTLMTAGASCGSAAKSGGAKGGWFTWGPVRQTNAEAGRVSDGAVRVNGDGGVGGLCDRGDGERIAIGIAVVPQQVDDGRRILRQCRHIRQSDGRVV